MVGMADGYAQATGRPTHVNLHTAPGVGNAVGGIFNAQANKAPLVITAGQQVRAQMAMEAQPDQPRRRPGPPAVRQVDATSRPARRTCPARPRPRDPPRLAAAEGPGVRLDPDGRLERRGRPRARPPGHRPARDRSRGPRRTPRSPRWPSGSTPRAPRCWSPARTSTPPAAGMPRWRWPRRSGCPSGRRRRPAAAGSASRRTTRSSSGCCRRRSARCPRRSRPTTSCWSSARSVFPYYPYIPGPLLAEGARARGDHQRSRARPPGRRWATRSSATSALALAALAELRRRGGRRPGAPPTPGRRRRGPGAATRCQRQRRRWPRSPTRGRRTGSPWSSRPSSTMALRNRLRLPRPGSYFFGASGGLGFGISAALGVQLAQPGRPVVCVLGEGSAQYGITALWTAVAYKLPVTFLVLRNQRVLDPQVVLGARAGHRRAGARSPRPRRRRGRPGLRHAGARRCPTRGAHRGAA